MPLTTTYYLSTRDCTLRCLVFNGSAPSNGGGPSQPGPIIVHQPTFTDQSGNPLTLSTPAPLAFDNYLLWQVPPGVTGVNVTQVAGAITTPDGASAALTNVAASAAAVLIPVTDRTGVVTGVNLPDTGQNRTMTVYGDRVRASLGWQPWGGGSTYTTDSNDQLLTLAGSVIAQVAGTGLSNGLDSEGYPTCPAGAWTVFFRGTTAFTARLVDLNGVLTDITADADVVSGGVTKRVYHLNPPAGKLDCTLYLEVTQSGGGACDFVPLGVFPPGESADGSQYLSQILATQLAGFPLHRTMDLDAVNSSNQTLASQTPSPDKLFPSRHPAAVTANVVSVSPYTGGTSAWPDTPCQLLLTTASAHPFTSEMTLRVNGPGLIGLPFADGNTYSLDGLKTEIRVLSPTTFAGFAGAPAQLSGSHTVTGVVASEDLTPPCPVEHKVAFARLAGATQIHVNIPHGMTSTEVRTLADRYFAVVPKGWTVRVERSNELWNRSIGFTQSFSDEEESAAASVTPQAYHVAQSKIIHDAFEASRVANGFPAGTVKRVIASWWGSVAWTQAIAAAAQATGYQFDELPVAPYVDTGPASGFDAWWAASTADQRFDALELFVTHSTNYTAAMASHQAALVAAGLTAKVAVYEWSLESLCPAGTGYGPKSLADSFHPRAGDIVDAVMASFRAQGVKSASYYAANLPNGPDNSGVTAWNYSMLYGPATVDGVGDGSDSLNNNFLHPTYDKVVSPVAKRLRQWAVAGAPGLIPVSPTPTPSPTVPVVIDVTQHGADPSGVADSASAIQALVDAATGPIELYYPAGFYSQSKTIRVDHDQVSVRGDGDILSVISLSTRVPGFAFGIADAASDGATVSAVNRPDGYGVYDASVATAANQAFGYLTGGRQLLMSVNSQFVMGTYRGATKYDYHTLADGHTMFLMLSGRGGNPLPVNLPICGSGDYQQSDPEPFLHFLDPDTSGVAGVLFAMEGDDPAHPRVFRYPLGGRTGVKKLQPWIDNRAGTAGAFVNGASVAITWGTPSDANFAGLRFRRNVAEMPWLIGSTGSVPGTYPVAAATDIVVYGHRLCNAAVKTDPGTDQLRYFAQDSTTVAYLDARVNSATRYVSTYERDQEDVGGGGHKTGCLIWMDGNQSLDAQSSVYRVKDISILNAAPAILVHRTFSIRVENFIATGGWGGIGTTRYVNSYTTDYVNCDLGGSQWSIGEFSTIGSMTNVVLRDGGNYALLQTGCRTRVDSVLVTGFGGNLQYVAGLFPSDDGPALNCRLLTIDNEGANQVQKGFVYAKNGTRYGARVKIETLSLTPVPGLPAVTLEGSAGSGVQPAYFDYDPPTYDAALTVDAVQIIGPTGQWTVTQPGSGGGSAPVVAFGSGGDADRLTVNGVATGPHLTGPQGAAGANGSPVHTSAAVTEAPVLLDGQAYRLAADYHPGDGILKLETGAGAKIALELTAKGLGPLSATAYAYVAVVPAANFAAVGSASLQVAYAGTVIFKVTGVPSGHPDWLTAAPAESGTDAPCFSGDAAGFVLVGAHVLDLASMIRAVDARVTAAQGGP